MYIKIEYVFQCVHNSSNVAGYNAQEDFGLHLLKDDEGEEEAVEGKEAVEEEEVRDTMAGRV